MIITARDDMPVLKIYPICPNFRRNALLNLWWENMLQRILTLEHERDPFIGPRVEDVTSKRREVDKDARWRRKETKESNMHESRSSLERSGQTVLG